MVHKPESDIPISETSVGQLANHYLAGFRVGQVISHEPKRIRNAAFALARHADIDDSTRVYCWSIASGVHKLTARGKDQQTKVELDDSTVTLCGELLSLTNANLMVLEKTGVTWRFTQGSTYWLYSENTLQELSNAPRRPE